MVQTAERNSLLVDGHMDNFDYLVDEISNDTESKKMKKLQNVKEIISNIVVIATVIEVITVLVLITTGVMH